jgi:hypothetical protein
VEDTTMSTAVKEKKPAVRAKGARTSKKTPPVVAIVGPQGVMGSFLSEQRPLIAHLPVNTSAIQFDATNELKYDPSIPLDTSAEVAGSPQPFDQGSNELSFLDSQTNYALRPRAEEGPSSHTPTKCKLPSNYAEKLMVMFQDSNRYQTLPEKTDVSCFWCCHSFHTAPFAIPSHILDEIWYMYGNFCSAECATSYLFKERIDSHVQWERYALLNSLYADDAAVAPGSPKGIRPAPPREVLRMFGGSMDISEYRAVLHEKKLRVDVLTPPMVSIIQTMDTKPIDFYDQNLKNVFIRNDIQHKYNAPGAQGLRLRRSKPVKSREATVEWAMQIQQAKAS